MSGLTALGSIAKNKAPTLAVTLHPLNGFAAENLASASIKTSIAVNSGQFPDHIDPTVTKLALKAFIAEPVTPAAVAVLALAEAQQSKQKLMSEAFLLSRRQPLVSAWMIADSGARQDVPALLNHYDTMLRTSTSAATIIIPFMANALANDSFVRPFANLLAKLPSWAPQFWGTVVETPGALVNAARLREILYQPNENDAVYRDDRLIQALVSNQQFETAEALFHLLAEQKEDNSLLKNSSFETEPEYSPIDWQLFSTGEYGAVVADGKLELSAIRNSGGLFARQLVNLPPRIVTLDIKSQDSISDNARVTVGLQCAEISNNAPQRIRISLKNKTTSSKIDNSRSGCSFYWFDINGRASENGEGFDIVIDSISLR